MTERPVLILGAGSDIGLALAHRFAKDGRPIQLAARRPAELEADRSDIALRHGIEVTAYAFDALALDRVEAFYDSLPTMPGVVISVVGLLGNQAETERDPEKARLVAETNFLGPTVALEAAARRLAELDEDTAIIGVSSVAGDRGRAKNYWYGASKAAYTTALSGLRQKYAGTKVHVMTVKPGFVATKTTEGMNLIGPLTATPEEIARLIAVGLRRRRRVVTPFRWRMVMTVISAIPEFVFDRLRF